MIETFIALLAALLVRDVLRAWLSKPQRFIPWSFRPAYMRLVNRYYHKTRDLLGVR